MSVPTDTDRMSDRERHCFAKQLEAVFTLDDPDLGDYWKEQGLLARHERLIAPEVHLDAPRKRKTAKPKCAECGSTDHTNAACLL